MSIDLKILILLALATACLGAAQRAKPDHPMRKNLINDFFGPDGKVNHQKWEEYRKNIKANKHRWQRAAKKVTANKPNKNNDKNTPGSQIYGGEEGQENMPWMAYITTVNADNNTVHECSGFIINETKIVTAAQCLERGNKSYVTVGDIDRTSASAVTITVPYTMWIVPKEFMMNGLESDIAVFNLSTPLVFNDKIKAAPLPPASMYKAKGFSLNNLPVTMYGYGHAVSTDPDCPAPDGPAYIFNVAQTNVNNDTKYCEALFKSNYQKLAKTHMCTTTRWEMDTPGACDADNGGPVMYTIPAGPSGLPVVIGVISMIEPCNTKNPVTFTDINKVIKFVESASKMKQPK